MNEKIINLSPYYNASLPFNISMMGETFCDDKFDVVRTRSELMALEFIADGKGTLEIDGKCVYPQKNDIFFLRKGSAHHYYSSRENPWHKYWIIFEGPFAEMLVHNYMPDGAFHFPNCSISENINNALNAYEAYLKHHRNYARLCDEISVELLNIAVYLKHRGERANESLAELIRQKLDFYVEQEFSLDKICDELKYSKNHIIQVFEGEYGITPYQYYITQKCDAAKIYLQNTTLPVGEIAQRLSYCDQRYFSACFKSIVGMSPTQYRKKMQP